MSKIIKADYLLYSSEKRGISQIKKDYSDSIDQKKINYQSDRDSDQIFEETKKKLEDMINNAKNKAEKIIMEAKMNAEVIQEEAFSEIDALKEAAFEEGFKQGLEKAETEIKESREKADHVLQTAFEEKERMLLDSETEIIDFIISSIEAVYIDLIKGNEEMVVALSKKLLQFAKEAKGQVTIKVSQADYQTIEPHTDDLAKMLSAAKLSIKTDDALSPGTMMVLSENGITELNVSENIEKIQSILMDVNQHD